MVFGIQQRFQPQWGELRIFSRLSTLFENLSLRGFSPRVLRIFHCVKNFNGLSRKNNVKKLSGVDGIRDVNRVTNLNTVNRTNSQRVSSTRISNSLKKATDDTSHRADLFRTSKESSSWLERYQRRWFQKNFTIRTSTKPSSWPKRGTFGGLGRVIGDIQLKGSSPLPSTTVIGKLERGIGGVQLLCSMWNTNFCPPVVFVLLLCPLIGGCKANISYNISSDPIILDLGQRIEELRQDQLLLEKELKDIHKALNSKEGPPLSVEVIASLHKEILESEVYKKSIHQWTNYLKIQRKKRYHSLRERKRRGVASLSQLAEKESQTYFMEKKLKPIPKTWKQKYRTVLGL